MNNSFMTRAQILKTQRRSPQSLQKVTSKMTRHAVASPVAEGNDICEIYSGGIEINASNLKNHER